MKNWLLCQLFSIKASLFLIIQLILAHLLCTSSQLSSLLPFSSTFRLFCIYPRLFFLLVFIVYLSLSNLVMISLTYPQKLCIAFLDEEIIDIIGLTLGPLQYYSSDYQLCLLRSLIYLSLIYLSLIFILQSSGRLSFQTSRLVKYQRRGKRLARGFSQTCEKSLGSTNLRQIQAIPLLIHPLLRLADSSPWRVIIHSPPSSSPNPPHIVLILGHHYLQYIYTYLRNKFNLYYPILPIRYYIIHRMEQDYQKYVTEIQFLRKQISGEKLAHENTIKQLQSSYQIIDQIKDALRAEQSTTIKLKNDLTATTSRLVMVVQQYQEQIRQIKEMISLKDEELRRINSFLMVNDADIIRLKVINEVELTHKQELQKLHLQISKKAAVINQLNSSHSLLVDKNEYLQKQQKIQEQQHKDQVEQLNNKYISQLKDLFQRLQSERGEHSKWEKKYELLQARLQKQTDFYKSQINKLKQQLQNENKSLLSNNEAKINKHKLDKLEEAISKLKEEIAEEKHVNGKLEDQVNRYKKEIKNNKKTQIDFAIEREKHLQEIQKLKDELAFQENLNKKSVQAAYKEYQEKSDDSMNTVKQSKQIIQKLEIQNKKLSYRVQQLQAENQTIKEQQTDKSLASIKRQLSSKQDQITSLKRELLELRKKQGQKKRTISLHEKKDENTNHHKAKLQQANEKIVELLREKIELKREISALKAKK